MKRYADVVSGSVLAVIGVVMLVESRHVRALMAMEFGPKIMPQIYSVGLIVLGAVIAISGWLRARQNPDAAQSSHLGNVSKKNVIFTMGLIAFYVAALRPLGFIVTSITYLFLQIIVLGGVPNRRQLLSAAIVAVSISFGIYHLFYGVFNVFLPPGRIW